MVGERGKGERKEREVGRDEELRNGAIETVRVAMLVVEVLVLVDGLRVRVKSRNGEHWRA
ncbi:hypothetical protein E2C01_086692 [Portunus trituberculatus]|uniref:Uncharacterized protein n=1 Tax=Portunus trituberculatus TaxID=210409 RepID=A0A5B7J1I3_PORTR|nr:hypothetical protein [Portunus trituberculatus]